MSTFAFLRSVDDFRLPLGPYVKALDYYGNPVTIDDSTRCTLIRHHREVPQAPSEAVLELLRAENNGTLPEGVLTAEEIAELYAAPQLKLKNVEQTANNGVIDFSSLDYSAFPRGLTRYCPTSARRNWFLIQPLVLMRKFAAD